ncbi:MAG: aminoglycoside phosphotransferase family protein [Bacilli bacterium]|nr:aminoglycoside phosphotransferase family protein [Bacilli bacterium]
MAHSIDTKIKKVAKEFLNVDMIEDIKELKGGHINSTYLIKMPEAEYILQQINNEVFVSPFGMMHNIQQITDYIRRKVIYDGKNPNRCVLNIVKTTYDQMLCVRDNQYWRCMQYIDNSTAYEHLSSPDMFEEMGSVVGEFQNLLEGFHTRILDETIPHFHDTPYRYKHFLNTVKIDPCERAKDVKEDIDFIKSNKSIYPTIVKWIEDQVIPRRVTHNDTKPSNVLFDDVTGKALCLIDLDTVMRGSLLYDYGDALRIGCSTAPEDEEDLSKVNIDLNMFKYFTRGFLRAIKGTITKNEVKGLFLGFKIITCEIAMRFLDDYIDGDHYFKIAYPTHNLVRARCQIQMVKALDAKEQEIHKIINDILTELGYDDSYHY